MKGSSLETIPVLLELFGHRFSFLWPHPEQAFTLPYNPTSPNTKSGGVEGKKSHFHQAFKSEGVLLAAGADISNEELLAFFRRGG